MKLFSQLRERARTLLRLSLDADGQPSAERVEGVLAYCAGLKPSAARPLLRAYLTLVRREVRRTEAVVETAAALPEAEVAALAASLSKTAGRRLVGRQVVVPALLGGVRVRVGDDLYDNSVAGRLEALATAVRR